METSKFDSSHRQTETAIILFKEGKYDCAITLASAAENMLPDTEKWHIFQALKADERYNEMRYNLMINWLKHSDGPETRAERATLSELEVVVIIARAISKFIAVYGETCQNFEDFLNWAVAAGHLPKRTYQISD